MRVLLLSVLFPICFLPLTLWGTVLPVTQNGDDGPGTFRQVLRDAAHGDTLFFAIRDTVFLDSTLQVRKSLYLLGPGPDLLVLSGQGRKRILQVDTLAEVYMLGLGFYQGDALRDSADLFFGGGAIRNYGKLTLVDCIFRENNAGYGGAIDNSGANGREARLEMLRCTFTGNVADPPQNNPFLLPRGGGAVFSNTFFGGRSKVIATNCTFSGNRGGQAGGGILVLQPQGDTTRSFVCFHCTITDNEADGAGGVDVGEFGLTYYKNTLIAGNRGRSRNPNVFGNMHSLGGLLVGKIEFNTSIGYEPGPNDQFNVDPLLSPLDYYGGLTPTHALQCNSPAIDAGVDAGVTEDQRNYPRVGAPDIGALERNNYLDVQVSSKGDGGAGSLRAAVFNACPGDTLDLSGLLGTIRLGSEIMLDKDLSIFGNPGATLWLNATGATRIFAVDTGVSVHLRDLSLAHGRPALYGGGAILNRGRLKVERMTFFNNAAISGGAIANYGDGAPASLDAINCTFSGNRATLLDGGAVDNYYFTHPTEAFFHHCTFTGNEAGKRGGAIYNEAQAEVSLYNTLIAGNSGPEFENLYGAFRSEGHNLLGDDQGFTLNGGASDLFNTDPLLGPLQYHGGSSYTHALSTGSPAIDAGDNDGAPALDQRGYPRIFNGTADIGAYEYDPATSVEPGQTREMIRVFPNPSKGRFRLELPAGWMGTHEIRILDLQGRVVHRQVVAGREVEVATRDLPPGVYVLQVQTENAKPGGCLIQIL